MRDFLPPDTPASGHSARWSAGVAVHKNGHRYAVPRKAEERADLAAACITILHLQGGGLLPGQPLAFGCPTTTGSPPAELSVLVVHGVRNN